MLAVSSSTRIYLYRGVTDMRKSFNGLSAIIQDSFPGELLSGSLFLFLNRSRNRVKLLYWDSDGFALWYKHLQKGRFKLPSDDERYLLQRRELMALLEGVTPLKFESRFSFEKS